MANDEQTPWKRCVVIVHVRIIYACLWMRGQTAECVMAAEKTEKKTKNVGYMIDETTQNANWCLFSRNHTNFERVAGSAVCRVNDNHDLIFRRWSKFGELILRKQKISAKFPTSIGRSVAGRLWIQRAWELRFANLSLEGSESRTCDWFESERFRRQAKQNTGTWLTCWAIRTATELA